MEQIVTGAVRFKRTIFPRHRELFAALANGQQPEALFITCSDSRIDPNLVTQTRPGDLFIVRNAGNIVPPHSRHAGGVTATIEYGVAVLNVGHIVVCGHTHCGAMQAALNPDAVADLPHVASWLDHSRAAVAVVKERRGGVEPEHVREVIENNVLLQLQHLRTHPVVAARLATGRIELHGWVYEIDTGEVLCHDDASGTFKPLAERYRALLTESAAARAG